LAALDPTPGFAPGIGSAEAAGLRLAAPPLMPKAEGDTTLLMPCPLEQTRHQRSAAKV